MAPNQARTFDPSKSKHLSANVGHLSWVAVQMRMRKGMGAMTTDNRTSEPSEEQVEAAARAIADNLFSRWTLTSRVSASKDRGSLIHVAARAALVAAAGAAPQAVSKRTPEFEAREQELFKHQPLLSMKDGGIAGCKCMDRVFYGKTEDWGTHLAEVFDKLAAPVQPSSTVDEAAHDAEVAAKALEDAADSCPLTPVGDWLRARAAEYREESQGLDQDNDWNDPLPDEWRNEWKYVAGEVLAAADAVVTVDGLQERIEDTLAYYQCRETNPKADHPSMGYHAFSEEQREFLRERKSEAAAEIVRMILALLRGGGRR